MIIILKALKMFFFLESDNIVSYLPAGKRLTSSMLSWFSTAQWRKTMRRKGGSYKQKEKRATVWLFTTRLDGLSFLCISLESRAF